MSNEDTKESIEDLIVRYQEDYNRELMDKLVLKLLPLVENITARFITDRNVYDDIKQVAAIGMLKAIKRYDFNKNSNFYSYLTPMVIGEIKHFYRDQGWLIKVPRKLKDLHQKVYKAIPELAQIQSRTPTPSEVAEFLSVSIEEVIEALNLGQNYNMMSLNNYVKTDKNESIIELDHIIGSIDQSLNKLEDYSEVEEIFSFFTTLDKELIRLRYFDKLTQNKIADILGVSQMQVSRLLKQLESKIKRVKAKVSL